MNRRSLLLAGILAACSAQPPVALTPESSEIVTGCISGANFDATGFIVRRDGQLLQWFRQGPQPIATEQTQALRTLDSEETAALFNALAEMNFVAIEYHKRAQDMTCYLTLRSEAQGVIHEVSWAMRTGAPLPVNELFLRIDALTRPEGAEGEAG